MAIKSYRDLQVWQKAMDLVVESYKVARLLPRVETSGLASQIQRSAMMLAVLIRKLKARAKSPDT